MRRDAIQDGYRLAIHCSAAAAGPPTADKCVVLLSLVHQPGETSAPAAPASFVVHTPTKTQRKRNETQRRRRRDDKLVTVVSR